MITTIIFDLSEVFLQGLYGTEKLLEKKLGLSIPNKDLMIPALEQLFHGEITEEQYWEAVIEHYGWSISVDEAKKIVRENFTEIDGTRPIAERLKEQGFRLGLLSVNAKEWVDHCEKEFDFHKLFDSHMYSFEVALCKPEKKAFQLMLDKLHVKAEECLFIDDIPRNVESAREMGITVIHFVSAEQLREDLKKLEIYV